MTHTLLHPDLKELHPLTTNDYHVLIEVVCLNEQRVKLVNGFRIPMQPKSVEQRATAKSLLRNFTMNSESSSRPQRKPNWSEQNLFNI